MDLLKITERLEGPVDAQATLTLPFELRQKSRLHTQLDSGEEVGLMLSRGTVLRGGDCLRAENGLVIKLQAAAEPVSSVTSDKPLLLLRACYHLGNRHVAMQIDQNRLRYLQDHVLDEMVTSMGLTVHHQQAPFEPEAGAYHHHAHDDSKPHKHD